MKKFLFRCGLFVALFMVVCPVYSATTTSSKQAAIQQGTKVRTRTDAAGLYNQECYDAYYGCMDQFCILDNTDGGSCACSNKNAGFEVRMVKIKDTLAEANRLKTEEVERVQAGANADIIFDGTREYDAQTGDVAKKSRQVVVAEKKKSLLELWDDIDADNDIFDTVESIAEKAGDALYAAADELCMSQMDMDACGKDITLLKQMYSRQIVSDCKGFENSIVKKEQEAKQEMDLANAAVRSALKESLDYANKYDRGECMVEYRKCMQGDDACGANWENCVFTIAAENMQNNKAKSTAGTKVKTTVTYNINDSTMEMLQSKRYICERVLDQCVAVRDNVWNDFLREAAPTIRLAETKAESAKRQSCLGDISNCIQKACKDDIAGKGKASMDACLARPDMARSFCKVEIDPCERMEPQIWSYVTDKLAAMRVDACTAQVKECLTDADRCGTDYVNCVGLDTDTIVNLCPSEKLTACNVDERGKTLAQNEVYNNIERIISGIMLNIDNSMLTVCQNALDESMVKVCGDTNDCVNFTVDENLGTRSFKYQVCKYDSISGDKIQWTSDCRESVDGIAQSDIPQPNGKGWAGKLSGIVYWGDVEYKKNQDGEYGFTTVNEYMKAMRDAGQELSDDDKKIISDLVYGVEIRQLENSVEQTISAIESDPRVQYCITGRQVPGLDGKMFGNKRARFPNLTNSVRERIALKALKVARENYGKKYDAEMERMMQDQTKIATSLNKDIAAQVCKDWADKSTLPASQAPKGSNTGTWIAIGAIVGASVVASIFTGGATLAIAGKTIIDASVGSIVAAGGAGIAAVAGNADLSVGRANVDNWNYKMNVTTTFDRETGECTKVTVTQNCKTVKKNYCQEWADAQESTTTVNLM